MFIQIIKSHPLYLAGVFLQYLLHIGFTVSGVGKLDQNFGHNVELMQKTYGTKITEPIVFRASRSACA